MNGTGTNGKLWAIWAISSVLLAAALGAGLSLDSEARMPLRDSLRTAFLPGQTSSGHYQIELRCEACHTAAFGGKDALQEACENCHAAELKIADDSHPRSKFTDPRNADRAALLDAARCVTCHVEHRPETTHAMGLTLPEDYCAICHQDVGENRPSHKGLAFDSCASSGCHNFHDNRALYEDFLVKHAGEPVVLEAPVLPARDFLEKIEELSDYPSDRYPVRPLASADADHGDRFQGGPAATKQAMGDWLATAHAKAGVNCSACHQTTDDAGKTAWLEHPDHRVCTACHGPEVEGFLSGKHGMRLRQGLPAMRPADARQRMQARAHDKRLGCMSCHMAHRFDTKQAAVEACVGCHDDGHSRAYKASKHYVLWQREVRGEAPAGSGVSCASCHLPRASFDTPDYVSRILVQHNQSDSLRPNEKMIRPACMHCHGLRYSIDALADTGLIRRNFRGGTKTAIKSIDMALEAEARADAERRAAKDS